jgi:hypothetical protein
MTNNSRADNLTDLADAVRQLTQPRHHVEYLEETVTEERATSNGRRKAKRTRRRRAHHTNQPALLDALADAMIPGATGEPGAPAGFESRPAAELEPAAVLRGIRDDATRWARHLGLPRDTLPGTLTGLVGARHTDDQLANITDDARGWVRRARLACGIDDPPVTLADPCPYCQRRNCLVITGDLTAARCTRCGVTWNVDTIGLLADMVRANQERETMADLTGRCWMPDCTLRGPHARHQDGRGRSWGDSCDIAVGG